MSQIYDFILSQWYYIAGIMAVLYMLLQEDDVELTDGDLSPQDLSTKMNEGNVTIFDIREKVDYNHAHIDGAKSIQIANNMSAITKIIKHNMAVVLVCSDGSMSAKVLKRIRPARRAETFLLKGGMKAWQSESFPVKVNAEFVEAKS